MKDLERKLKILERDMKIANDKIEVEYTNKCFLLLGAVKKTHTDNINTIIEYEKMLGVEVFDESFRKKTKEVTDQIQRIREKHYP